MKDHRAGEVDTKDRLPERGERFFKLHNFWFFATREGASIGPYDAKAQAIEGVSSYIEFVNRVDPSTLQWFTTDTKFGA